MGDQKLYSLQLEWKDISGGVSNTSLQVEVDGLADSLQVHGRSQFMLSSVSLDSVLSLQIKPNFSTSQSFRTVFGGKLQGKVDKHFHLKSEDGSALKVRLGLQLTDTSSRRSSSRSVPRRNSSKKLQCPYLEALSAGQDVNGFEDLWKARQPTGNSLKLFLEPDSPTKALAGEEHGLSEDLDLASLGKMQGSQLKTVVKGLFDTAKHLQVFAQQLPAMRENMKQKIKERRDLEENAETVTEGLKSASKGKDSLFKELLALRKNAGEQLEIERGKLRNTELELDSLQVMHGDLQREEILKTAQDLRAKDTDDMSANYQAVLEDILKNKQEVESFTKSAMEDLAEETRETVKENDALKSDISALNAQIKELEEKLTSTQSKNKEQQERSSSLKCELADVDLGGSCKTAHDKFLTECQNQQSVLGKLSKLSQDLYTADIDLSNRLEGLVDKKQQLDIDQGNLENEDTELKQVVNELKRRLLDSTSQHITIEQTCCIRGDQIQLVEQLNELRDKRSEVRNSVLADLNKGASFLAEETEKMYNKSKQLDTMIDLADNAESEIDNLKGAMGELRRRNPPYVPASDDPVDIALAEAINSRKDPLPVNFVREAPGKYAFGSKKVNVKVENGRLLFRSGNSYMAFEEFVQLVGNKESEKETGVGSLFGKLPATKKAAAGKAFLGFAKGKKK